MPGVVPLLAKLSNGFGLQLLKDGRQEFVCLVKQFNRFEVLVIVGGSACANAQGVYLGMTQTEEIIEHHWAKRLAEIHKLLRW